MALTNSCPRNRDSSNPQSFSSILVLVRRTKRSTSLELGEDYQPEPCTHGRCLPRNRYAELNIRTGMHKVQIRAALRYGNYQTRRRSAQQNTTKVNHRVLSTHGNCLQFSFLYYCRSSRTMDTRLRSQSHNHQHHHQPEAASRLRLVHTNSHIHPPSVDDGCRVLRVPQPQVSRLGPQPRLTEPCPINALTAGGRP